MITHLLLLFTICASFLQLSEGQENQDTSPAIETTLQPLTISSTEEGLNVSATNTPPLEYSSSSTGQESSSVSTTVATTTTTSSSGICDDAYTFTCNRFNTNSSIPEKTIEEIAYEKVKKLLENIEPSTSVAINKAKQFYRACNDQDYFERTKTSELLRAVRELGGWPLVEGNTSNWNVSAFDLTRLLLEVEKLRDVGVFFAVKPHFDETSGGKLTYLTKGVLGMGDNKEAIYIGNEEGNINKKQNYSENLFQRIRLLVADAASNRTDAEIRNDVAEILELETQIARLLVHYTTWRSTRRSSMSLVTRHYPIVRWEEYLRGLIPLDLEYSLNVIYLQDYRYFSRLYTLLNGTNKRILTNYIMTRFALKWTHQLDRRFDDVDKKHEKELNDREISQEVWCKEFVIQQMHHVADAIYCREHFEQPTRQAILDIIQAVKTLFISKVSTNDWMDDFTRRVAREMLAEMVPQFGCPDLFYNDTALDDQLKNLVFGANDTLPEMLNSLRVFRIHQDFRNPLNSNPHRIVNFEPRVFNPQAVYAGNNLWITACLIEPQLYDKNATLAANFPRVATLVASILYRSYSCSPILFYENRSLDQRCSRRIRNRANQKKRCMYPQRDRHSLALVSDVTDHVADISAIELAREAYLSLIRNSTNNTGSSVGEFTAEQNFWLTVTQVHCGKNPANVPFRSIDLISNSTVVQLLINQILMNQRNFASTFNCSLGSHMNPVSKCLFW